MENSGHEIYYAKNLSELFSQLKNIKDLYIIGSTTALDVLPPKKIISVRHIPELKNIDTHERYINFGSAVTLAEIMDEYNSKTKIPKIFYDAIKTVANSNIRNIATLGGNICARMNNVKYTLYSPLLALDAQLEFMCPKDTITKRVSNNLEKFRRKKDTKIIPITNFENFESELNGYILTRIRVPIHEWNFSIFKRIGPEHKIDETSASFSFLISKEKDKITNARIALSGSVNFRARELENSMIGLRLPLSPKDINMITVGSARQFDASSKDKVFPPALREQFLNLAIYSAEQVI